MYKKSPPIIVMDNKKVNYVGIVKQVSLYLDEHPRKRLLMNIVMIIVESSFSLLLYRWWNILINDVIQIYLLYELLLYLDGKKYSPLKWET